MNNIFKVCPMCSKRWANLDTFLDDPTITLNGYQPNFGNEERGLFSFTHDHEPCGSSMLIQVEHFLMLYNGPRHEENLHRSEDCRQLCLDQNNIEKCTAKCKYAYVREILQIVAERTGENTAIWVR